jgi:hypothetical protein
VIRQVLHVVGLVQMAGDIVLAFANVHGRRLLRLRLQYFNKMSIMMSWHSICLAVLWASMPSE